jgi:hypothetical protein
MSADGKERCICKFTEPIEDLALFIRVLNQMRGNQGMMLEINEMMKSLREDHTNCSYDINDHLICCGDLYATGERGPYLLNVYTSSGILNLYGYRGTFAQLENPLVNKMLDNYRSARLSEEDSAKVNALMHRMGYSQFSTR